MAWCRPVIEYNVISFVPQYRPNDKGLDSASRPNRGVGYFLHGASLLPEVIADLVECGEVLRSEVGRPFDEGEEGVGLLAQEVHLRATSRWLSCSRWIREAF